MDEFIPKMGIAKRPSSSLIAGAKTTLNPPRPDPAAKQSFPITFRHLGKGGYELTLYSATHVQRRKWMEHIEGQQSALRSRGNFFTKTILCDRFFNLSNRVNCLAPIGQLDRSSLSQLMWLTQYRRRAEAGLWYRQWNIYLRSTAKGGVHETKACTGCCWCYSDRSARRVSAAPGLVEQDAIFISAGSSRSQ